VQANRDKTVEHGIARVLLQSNRDVSDLLNCPATPTALAIGADGHVLLPAAPGGPAIEALVATLVGQPSPAPGLQVLPPEPASAPELAIGSPAPALSLTDLDGEPIDLSDPRSGGRLLVFWNPACGFCSQMLDDLRAWEDQRRRGTGPR